MARRDIRRPPRIVVGITGGEGTRFGLSILEALQASPVETHLVICECGRRRLRADTGQDPDSVSRLADHVYRSTNQAARISSGSFLTDGMVIAPCSQRSLAAIASGIGTTLIHRAADVVMKEGRTLVLVCGTEASPGQGQLNRLAGIPSVVAMRPSLLGDDSVAYPTRLVQETVDRVLSHFVDLSWAWPETVQA
jgi:polyprenyl P-hydroxybenzoate/phenylacrylic acid decarboxylase-like protein